MTRIDPRGSPMLPASNSHRDNYLEIYSLWTKLPTTPTDFMGFGGFGGETFGCLVSPAQVPCRIEWMDDERAFKGRLVYGNCPRFDGGYHHGSPLDSPGDLELTMRQASYHPTTTHDLV